MRTKQKVTVLVEQRLARQRTQAYHDARALAIELGRGEPSIRFDVMAAGVVLRPGETVYRRVSIWIRVQQDGRWAEASYSDVLATDLRLLCRFASGSLTSLWWSGIVGLHVDLATEHIVLDFGDGKPVSVSGAPVAPLGVLGIASVYGVDAMLTHPALVRLRADPHPREGEELPSRRGR